VRLAQWKGQWPNALLAEAGVGSAYHLLNVNGPDGARWPTALQPIPLHPTGALPIDDGNFRYTAYTVHPEARFTPMNPGAAFPGTAILGGFAQFVGHDVVTLDWSADRTIFLTLYWRPTDQAPPPLDYSVFIELLDAEGTLLARWDGFPLQGQYATRYWQPGESLLDYWVFRVPDDVPTGPARLQIGLFDAVSGERLPVVVDGQAVGDALPIDDRLRTISQDDRSPAG
ncbi:MAG: hypothetical protein JW910_01590, partial [Anaerolineae bacterium]|nr:hypothetical protein [Anaerolineae bacterium]